MREFLYQKLEVKWLSDWKVFLTNRTVTLLTGFSLLFLLLSFAFLYINFYDVSHNIVLHFDIYRGIDSLGSVYGLYQNLGLAFFIVLLDILLAKALFEKNAYIAYLLLATSLYFSLLIFMGVLAIIGIN